MALRITTRCRFLVPALLLGVAFQQDVFYAQSSTADPIVYNDEMKIIRFADLAYPAAAVRAGEEGIVVVTATLDNRGRVVGAAAIAGPRLLVPETVANARQWRFEPNRLKRVVIVYRFALEENCAPGTVSSSFTWLGRNAAVITACRIGPRDR